MIYLYLAVAIAAEVIGTSALKASDVFTRLGPSVIVVVAYAVAFFFLAIVVRQMNVGIAYAIWSGLGIVLITIIGTIWFGERLDTAAIIGLGLIIAGVVTINLFSNTVPH
ncbi:DMT family transporter [Tepidamorphus sp. 3E244]|uniref:DMT family transporter n=1 Tax=Tepidamorphus sp. 3E244 TaxID=3385498 RepID=UPI0038FCC91D